MAAQKTSFYKSSQDLPDFDAVLPEEPDYAEEEEEACCVCDNPSTSGCLPENPGYGSVFTLAGAQLISYWGMK